MSIVRLGTRDDEHELLKLLTLMHEEGGMFDLDISRAQEMFSMAFDQKGGVLGVIGPPNDVQAAIFLLITRYWYTNQYHLEELFCYVRPDFRTSKHASDLLNFSKQSSDLLKLPLSIGVLSNIEAEGKLKLYYRKFGTPAGAFFAYGAKWVNGKQPSDDFWKVLFERDKVFAKWVTEREQKQRANGKNHPPQQLGT